MTASGGDLRADYQALRAGAGAVVLSRDVLSVEGADAAGYLQGQLSQDVAALAEGDSADSLLLEPDGKLDALLRVSRTGAEAFVLDVDGGFGEVVVARLARFRLRSKVVIEPMDWRCVALRGPGGRPAAAAAGSPGVVLRPAVDWHGWVGVDLLGPDPSGALAETVRWCSAEAWEACRVESAVPVMGRELDGRTIAAEADLGPRAVSFTKGCYTGQELVARLDARGNRVARHLRAVVGLDPTTTAADLDGAELWVPGTERPVGTVTSAAWSPALARAVGLAYVHRSVEPPAGLALQPVGGADPGPGAMMAEVRAVPLV